MLWKNHMWYILLYQQCFQAMTYAKISILRPDKMTIITQTSFQKHFIEKNIRILFRIS